MTFKDPERINGYKRKYYLKNREIVIERAKLWNKEHPNERKEIIKRNNKKRSTIKRIWSENKEYNGNATILGGKCFICGTEKRLHIHHIDGNNGDNRKPLNNDKDNLIILCIKCHAKVHNRWHLKNVYEYKSNRM